MWLDCDEVASGSDWHGAVGTALENCKAVLPVITSTYLSSLSCKRELSMADSEGKLVFPLFLEEVDLSTSEQASGVQQLISSSLNSVSFRNTAEYDTSLAKLIRNLKERGINEY